MRTLLIHADDFGLSDGVTSGILLAMRDGVVTATSAMVCSEADRERVRRNAPAVCSGALGLHLQLTDGSPLSPPWQIPSLINQNGRFPRRREEINGPVAEEVLVEWRAQLAAFRSLGMEPSHLDTHHSVHVLDGVAEAYCQLAVETGLPVRGGALDFNQRLRQQGISCADAYVSYSSGRRVDLAALLRMLGAMNRCVRESGTVEVGCHPAIADEELAQKSHYVAPREQELAVLTTAGLREQLEGLGYALAQPQTILRRREI